MHVVVIAPVSTQGGRQPREPRGEGAKRRFRGRKGAARRAGVFPAVCKAAEVPASCRMRTTRRRRCFELFSPALADNTERRWYEAQPVCTYLYLNISRGSRLMYNLLYYNMHDPDGVIRRLTTANSYQ